MNNAKERQANSLERLVFFSDAIFGIAITLLIIEIEIPQVGPSSDNAAYGKALIELLPNLFSFALSFLVIGRFWMGHHDLFGTVRGYDRRLLFPNLLFLMSIVFMPFATAFLGANLGAFVPALVYNLTLLTIAVLDWRLTSKIAEFGLVAKVVERFEYSHSVILVGSALLCVGLTFLIPIYSQAGMLLVPIGFAWLRHKSKRKLRR